MAQDRSNTVYWSSKIKLPDTAPPDVEDASWNWEIKQPSSESTVVIKVKDEIEHFSPYTDASQDMQDMQIDHISTNKRKRTPDKDLAAALTRTFPAKQLHQVKVAHITAGNQWQPVDPPQGQNIENRGIERTASVADVHHSILDYLTDVMRNAHWRGPAVPPLPPWKRDPKAVAWPRTNHTQIKAMIISNPFLLRLSRMLEGRFHAASIKTLSYVPAVQVLGRKNQDVPLEERYIAAILVQALGVENPQPCSLCAGEWNDPTRPRAAGEEEEDWNVRPFGKCVSLVSMALPARFAACGNHFWYGSVTDCACVNNTASFHPDEQHLYFYDSFNFNASNADIVKEMLKDEYMQIESSGVPDGHVRYGPFYVRSDVVNNPKLFAHGVELLAGVVQEGFEASRYRAFDGTSRVSKTRELLDLV